MHRLLLLSRILKHTIFDPDDFSFEMLQQAGDCNGSVDEDTIKKERITQVKVEKIISFMN